MPLHDRIVPYLERAGLYHLARLNARWFWLDEPLVSAFIERWRLETHTFHMPFGECTITLQDVAYQLGLPVDGLPVSGCLTDFEKLMKEGKLTWEWFQELFGELPPQNKGYQPQFHVDLNEPASSPYDSWLGMGRTPPSAYGVDMSVDPPAQQRQRPAKMRRTARCGIWSHLLGAIGHDSHEEDEDRQES
ncbi:hypothetical protein AHAS_Ahas20G0260100 [Arachis hypogaea]